MNREIKFRAWVPPITDGEISLPGFMDYDLGQQKIIATKTQTREIPTEFGFEHSQLGQYFLNQDLARYGDRLMQYTGLHDKNGKEIYEGDVICFIEDVIAETISGYPRYEPEGKITEVKLPDIFITLHSEEIPPANEIEVIGNIYENPELLR